MRNQKAVSVTIMGLKCDNPLCNFADMSIPYEDYPNWINKPCPLCGCNLLTQKDYDICKRTMDFANEMNQILEGEPEGNDEKDMIQLQMEFDGTGNITISEPLPPS